MKKNKKLLLVVISIVTVVSVLLFASCNSSYAANESETLKLLKSKASNYYEINPSEMLNIYALNSTGHSVEPDYRYNGKGILVMTYGSNGTEKDSWSDGIIDARDSTTFLSLAQTFNSIELNEGVSDEKIANGQKSWEGSAKDIIYSLAKKLNISENDVIVTVKVSMDSVKELNIPETSYILDNKGNTIAKNKEKITTLSTYNKKIVEQNELLDNTTNYKVTVTAETKNNGKYYLVLGKDNVFYLITDAKTDAEFDTTMKYDDTKDTGKTYKPEYTENDINKKDLDVTVTIKSETDEAIASTNGVALTDDKKPNSEGWYYPDTKDKTVIAKVYKFDEYDNTTANGKVNETVKLVGVNGGEDTQKPSIEWTFRRKNVDETENSDGSVTIVITYNLPVDEKSVPSDWKVIYDKDGKTVHKITKTIKKGEDYDKDVTVKQNGTDAKVTTHVKKTWKKDKTQAKDLGPQAGAFSVVLIAVIAGIAVFAVTRYRKLNK